MLHPSTKKLIDKLIEMTAATKITWTEGEDGTLNYDTEGYRVSIGQAPSGVVLLDAGGRVLETVSDSMLSGTSDESGRNYSVKVDHLVSNARRELSGAEAAISKIVSALDLTDREASETAGASETDVAAAPEPVAETALIRTGADPVTEASPEEGSPWQVPDEAGIADEDSEEDLGADETSPEPVFSPSSSTLALTSDRKEPVPEPETYAAGAAATSSAAEFRSVISEEPEIADAPVEQPAEPETSKPEPAFMAARPVVHPPVYWDGIGKSLNAIMVTPDIYIKPEAKLSGPVRFEPELAAPDVVVLDTEDTLDFSGKIGPVEDTVSFATDADTETPGSFVQIGGIDKPGEGDALFDAPYEFATAESEVVGLVTDETVEPEVEAAPESEATSADGDEEGEEARASEEPKEPATTEEVMADIRKTVYKYNPWM